MVWLWCGLFEANESDDECDGVDGGAREFERVILGVVGDDEDVVVVLSWFDTLDECALRGVEDVCLVPLEEDVGERYTLTGYDVA